MNSGSRPSMARRQRRCQRSALSSNATSGPASISTASLISLLEKHFGKLFAGAFGKLKAATIDGTDQMLDLFVPWLFGRLLVGFLDVSGERFTRHFRFALAGTSRHSRHPGGGFRLETNT